MDTGLLSVFTILMGIFILYLLLRRELHHIRDQPQFAAASSSKTEKQKLKKSEQAHVQGDNSKYGGDKGILVRRKQVVESKALYVKGPAVFQADCRAKVRRGLTIGDADELRCLEDRKNPSEEKGKDKDSHFTRHSRTSSESNVEQSLKPSSTPPFNERITRLLQERLDYSATMLLGIQMFQTTEYIGILGGEITIAGCSVLIPHGALTRRHEISLTCFFNVNSSQSEMQLITPIVLLEPAGLKFEKDVVITLPTCYHPVNKSMFANISIITNKKREGWTEHSTVENKFYGNIIFKTNHFSLFAALVHIMWNLFLGKSMYYVAYIKRISVEENPISHSLVWCICDNLPHMVAQIETSMQSHQHYERVIEGETFLIEYDHKLKITNTSADGNCEFSPYSRMISNRDLWLPWSIRKPTFKVNLTAQGFNQEYLKCKFFLQSGAPSVVNSTFSRDGEYQFTWNRPKTNSTKEINIINPRINQFRC